MYRVKRDNFFYHWMLSATDTKKGGLKTPDIFKRIDLKELFCSLLLLLLLHLLRLKYYKQL
jgi:hypothetical protein